MEDYWGSIADLRRKAAESMEMRRVEGR